MAGKRKTKNENGEMVNKPVIDANGEEIIPDEKKSEFAPFVGKRKRYGGSYPQYIELQTKINKYLNANITHTFNGLSLYLQCEPIHLKELESGKLDKQKTNFKPSDLIKQFRLYMENELYAALPLKTDADVERLAGKPPEEEEKDKKKEATISEYAG
jgi:hypothetical protein